MLNVYRNGEQVFQQLQHFSYMNEILSDIVENKPPRIIEVNTIGTRWSGKTSSIQLFTRDALLQNKSSVIAYFVRNTVQDAEELYSDTLKEISSGYGDILRYNKTKRRIFTKHTKNELRVMDNIHHHWKRFCKQSFAIDILSLLWLQLYCFMGSILG